MLQFKVMDVVAAMAVVFVLHTDSIAGNMRLHQLRVITREKELPWPTATFWESYPERVVESARPFQATMGFFL